MTPDQLYAACVEGFKRRKFLAGLLVAFIDFLVDLGVPAMGLSGFDDFLKRFPAQEETGGGQRANTLIVKLPDGRTLSLRPFYNKIEAFFRATNKRFDYPSCAPHATQAWSGYRDWLDALCKYSQSDLKSLRARICEFVLATLPSQEFVEGSVSVEPPLFKMILTSFDFSAQPGEKTGAAMQGIVFGFLRADNPHLQIEIDKVRTGSKRLQRVGDVDAWEGNRLAISAEVKQFRLKLDDVEDLAAFANETQKRSAIGIVFALGFNPDARAAINAQGVQTVDLDEMQKIVDLWDSMKQRTAVASLIYYVTQVEKSKPLEIRLTEFLKAESDSSKVVE